MKIETFQTNLTPFNRDVTFRVMTPDGYEVGDRLYPALYMNDGQDVFYDEGSVTGHSIRYAKYYTEYAKFLPQIIIVGIDCPLTNQERSRQYTPYTKQFDVPEWSSYEKEVAGSGREYLEWIVRELKPWIDENYRTRKQGAYTAMGGFSSGTIISTYALLTYPDVFSRLIAISGSFYIWMDCIDQTLAQANLDHVKYIYLDVSTREQGRITTAEQFLEGTKMMYERFSVCGFDENQLKYQIVKGLTHTQGGWRLRFPDAVRWIFQDVA
ncbi:MAG: alpha/beta hydrolase [Treponema sp.]|jgi:predicted alpha/beta superfamily hydrolase|nr:alpha/beta hydrolase [Treponema sp.]